VLFNTVLEERHVARAAVRLNLTPSAVSHGRRDCASCDRGVGVNHSKNDTKVYRFILRFWILLI
jgi:hypothetical protein